MQLHRPAWPFEVVDRMTPIQVWGPIWPDLIIASTSIFYQGCRTNSSGVPYSPPMPLVQPRGFLSSLTQRVARHTALCTYFWFYLFVIFLPRWSLLIGVAPKRLVWKVYDYPSYWMVLISILVFSSTSRWQSGVIYPLGTVRAVPRAHDTFRCFNFF